nr:unnamed protein product [Callosobruchus analis]
MEGALKVQPEQVSEMKPVKASTSKMEWHAQATIREGSVMLSIPETDDDNFIAVKKRKDLQSPNKKELIDSNTPHHTYTKEEDKVKRIVMKAAPNMDLDDIKEDLLKKNIVLTKCTPLVGRGRRARYVTGSLLLTGKAPQDMRGKHDTRAHKLSEETRQKAIEFIKSLKCRKSNYSLTD